MAARILQLACLLALVHCDPAQNNSSVISVQTKDSNADVVGSDLQMKIQQLPVNSQAMGQFLQMILTMLRDSNLVMVNSRPEERIKSLDPKEYKYVGEIDRPFRCSHPKCSADTTQPMSNLKVSQNAPSQAYKELPSMVVASTPTNNQSIVAGETPMVISTGVLQRTANIGDQKTGTPAKFSNETDAPRVAIISNTDNQIGNTEQNASTPVTLVHENVNVTANGSADGSEAGMPDTGFQNATSVNSTAPDSGSGSHTEVEEQSMAGNEISSASSASEEQEEDTKGEESAESSTNVDQASTATILSLSAALLPIKAVFAIILIN
uniref:AlNc14C174G8072 protein n=1 Tax=Albugo laibachii Nc14 TaxID=890382 RepID=F0WNQ8_9STRA|nr:AlNc14C174G8072 [Albugo laibachii Nc14]|eukprot:CCA22950.1 AlNc14C174G8072 [Albugo laibachii Nc14]